MLRATRHHDDGWEDWEANFDEPEPVQFNIPDLKDPLEIWKRTLSLAEQRDPVEAYLIGHHAYYLNHDRAKAFNSWLCEQQRRWVPEPPPALDRAGALLQTWDALSLTFCLRSGPASRTVPTEVGEKAFEFQWKGGALLHDGLPLSLTTVELRRKEWSIGKESVESCLLAPKSFTKELEEELLRLVALRGPGKTICPSEVPRSLGLEDWRQAMELTREVARELARAEKIQILQKGALVDPDHFKGPSG